MSSLVADVVDGQVNISESSQKNEKTTGSQLGKDDFLLLLVTQMKYQDPLQPTENTEYVSQLAQFTELEEMENLNSTTTNSSAFNLVGQEVYIQETSTTGNTFEVQGTVEYVTIQNGDAFVSVDGTLYSFDSITQVLDSNYVLSQYLPSVSKQSHIYMHQDPQDIILTGIDLGSNGYEATSLAAVIVNSSGETTTIDADKLKYSKGTLTIDKSVLATLDAGSYTIALAFDDANSTVNTSNVTLTVKGIKSATS